MRGGLLNDRHPVCVPAAVTSGVIALGGTLFVGTILAPWLSDALAALSDLEAFGASILFASSVRLLAGVYGGRSYRRRRGSVARHEPLVSVTYGVAAAWLVYLLVVLLAVATTGAGWPWLLLLELPRWCVEAALGVLLVGVGEPEDDTVVRRLARRGAGA